MDAVPLTGTISAVQLQQTPGARRLPAPPDTPPCQTGEVAAHRHGDP